MNTGRIRSEPRANTSDQVLRLVMNMYLPGRYPLPVEGYRAEVVQVAAGSLCIITKELPSLALLAVAVAEDQRAASQVWSDMSRLCAALSPRLDRPGLIAPDCFRPVFTPWYATLELFSSWEELPFLRDFCRHYAWGWIDHRQLCRIRECGALPD